MMRTLKSDSVSAAVVDDTPAIATAAVLPTPEPAVFEPAAPPPPARSASTFVNPISEGADPWVIHHANSYYFSESEGHDGIAVWKSSRLTDRGCKRVVWRPTPGTWNSREIWAPELHRLFGRWYIYYAASDGINANHRAGVLRALTDDPQGPYEDLGMLYTGDDVCRRSRNRWAIDATPLMLGNRLYLVWSGWEDTRDIQHLYIAPMENPWTVGGDRVRICANDTHVWERVAECPSQRGLHEGPTVFRRHGRVFLMYACSSSWDPTYKIGLLYMDERSDPLDPASWTKHDMPAMTSTPEVYGIGHACVTVSPDGSQDYIVYHSKLSRRPGWERAIWVQPFRWTEDGFPDFGKPIPAGNPLPLPSGELANARGADFRDGFSGEHWDQWAYYGHNRYIRTANGRLRLGGRPGSGAVNLYRSGEKALVRGLEWSDFALQVRVRIISSRRDAGVLFRVQEPGIGYDAQKGYFAGLIPGTGKLVVGYTDGRNWHELAIADQPVELGEWYTIRVEAEGPFIRVLVDGQPRIRVEDSRSLCGMAGVRVVDTAAEFDDFEVHARLT